MNRKPGQNFYSSQRTGSGALYSNNNTSAARRSVATPASSLYPSSPTRRTPSGSIKYRNNSDNIAAIFGTTTVNNSQNYSAQTNNNNLNGHNNPNAMSSLNGGPGRPRTRGTSSPAAIHRPSSSGATSGATSNQLASMLPPSPSQAFSLPYEARTLTSNGKSAQRPIQITTGAAGLQGFRPTMEDAHLSIIHGKQVDNHPVSFFAILDGHCGRRVADYGAKILPDCVFSHPELGKNTARAMVESIVQTDRLTFQQMGKSDGGSTLICALVYERMLFVACLGDARAVLYDGTETKAMSEDHKPGDPKEMQRISRCGGSVQFGRVCGCLAVSRALGDYEFKFSGTKFIPNKELMVSNVADVKQINITDQTRFLILACDGLWDVLTNEEATGFVVDYLKRAAPSRDAAPPTERVQEGGIANASNELQRVLEQCAGRLADYAIERGSMDNVSVTIIAFHTDLIADIHAAAGNNNNNNNTINNNNNNNGARPSLNSLAPMQRSTQNTGPSFSSFGGSSSTFSANTSSFLNSGNSRMGFGNSVGYGSRAASSGNYGYRR